jgi:hypothetical protein
VAGWADRGTARADLGRDSDLEAVEDQAARELVEVEPGAREDRAAVEAAQALACGIPAHPAVVAKVLVRAARVGEMARAAGPAEVEGQDSVEVLALEVAEPALVEAELALEEAELVRVVVV